MVAIEPMAATARIAAGEADRFGRRTRPRAALSRTFDGIRVLPG
jgi:hypothetical protein